MGRQRGRKVILSQEEIEQALERIAREIALKHKFLENIVIVGIRTGGAYLAFRLRDKISEKPEDKPLTGVLDINLYRDDWTRVGPKPKLRSTEIPFSTDDKIVILVDDVLFTGRTVRAAMDALMDFGRPKKIELVVLVDRGEEQRELPIKANYVAKEWQTSGGDTISAYFREEGFRDRVVVEKKEGNL